MVTGSHRRSVMRLLAALLTGLAGFMAFNVFDTVFGVPEALVGLTAWIVMTVFVFRRSPPAEKGPNA